MVVEPVPVVVFAQSQTVLAVWLKVVVSVPMDRERLPVGLARDDHAVLLAEIAAATKASVAILVELSPVVWVVAVVPFGKAGVPERLDAVPDVLAALFGISAETNARKVGVAADPVVGPARIRFAL